MAAGWCASLTKPEKGLWVIVILAAIAVLIFEWVLVVTDFVTFTYRSHVIYDEKDYLSLPTILVCSRDPINQTVASRALYSQNTIRYYQALNYPTPLMPGTNQQFQQYEVETANSELTKFYQLPQYGNNQWSAFLDLHYQCQGMVSRCQIGDGPNMTGYECCKAATPVITTVGPCFSLALPDQIYTPSYLGGFQIDFSIQSGYMQSSGVNFPGIDVYIGDSVEKPMSPVLRMQRNQIHAVKLEAQSYHKSNRRKCEKNMNSMYRSDMPYIMATLNCTAKIIYERCQCYPFYELQFDYNRYQNSICDYGKLNCANETLKLLRQKRNVTEYYNQYFSDVCGTIKPPCSYMRYQTTVNIDTDNPPSGDWASKLHFYYEDFQVLTIEQYFAPNFHDVIIQMGGAMVFWFVVVHILIYMVEGCKMCKKKQKQNNKIEDAEMMGPPSHHPPPIITHSIEHPPPQYNQPRGLAPLPPIGTEAHQETQTPAG